MTTALLSSAYFGPIQWYQKLNRYDKILIEQHDSFIKQTYRNRCIIATPNGQHWNALKSAYGESPFFEYYADDILPFFEKEWDCLYDFNMDICRVMCQLLDIEPDISLTDSYMTQEEAMEQGIDDFRDAIRPKHPLPDPTFQPREYYQVYGQRHGFLPNMSILDLLFNMGNESVLWL